MAVPTAYGVATCCVLRYHGGELDDGQGFTTDPNSSRAHIGQVHGATRIVDTDVVIWYAGHYVHDAASRSAIGWGRTWCHPGGEARAR